MRTVLATLVLAGGCALVLCAGGAAQIAGKPELGPVVNAIEDAQKAESNALELAKPATAEKANAAFGRAHVALESAVSLLGKQPVNDYDFREISHLIHGAEGYDNEFQMDGYGESRDVYEFHRAEEFKSNALWMVRDISEHGHGPPVVLDAVANDITTAFNAEDRARADWKKQDAGATNAELGKSRDALEAAERTVKQAARQHLISQSAAEGIVRHLEQAHVDDGNASVFIDPKNPYHGTIVATIEAGIEQKDEAMTALEHAIANPPKYKPGESPLEVTLSSVFVPADRATKYTAEATDKESRSLSYSWKLRLIRVDPVGSAPAGFQSTDPKAASYASAAFDATCNNALLPDGAPGETTSSSANYVWSSLKGEFVWYHGDTGSYAGSTYGCDHTKMGKRGHQGTVTVIVTDGTWTCRAEIFGSNLAEAPEHSPPATCSRG